MATTGMGPASALPYMGPFPYYGNAHGLRHYPCQVVITLDNIILLCSIGISNLLKKLVIESNWC